MSTEPVVDAELVEEPAEQAEQSTEIERVDPTASGKIILAEKPEEILTKATAIADCLADLVRAQDLARNMGGKKPHVEVGAWQALGALLGAFGGQPLHAETVWSRRVTDADGRPEVTTYHVKEARKKWGKVDGRRQIVEEIESEYDVGGCDWEARVEIRTSSGVVVGVAEAMCARSEIGWMSKPDPAVKSMAETRAESRAYRRAVGWLMVIAGYNPTPAEEMPPDQTVAAEPIAQGPTYGPAANDEQVKQVEAAIAYLLNLSNPDDARVLEILQWIATDARGYLPQNATRAVCHVGKQAKAIQVATAELPDEETRAAELLAAEHDQAEHDQIASEVFGASTVSNE